MKSKFVTTSGSLVQKSLSIAVFKSKQIPVLTRSSTCRCRNDKHLLCVWLVLMVSQLLNMGICLSWCGQTSVKLHNLCIKTFGPDAAGCSKLSHRQLVHLGILWASRSLGRIFQGKNSLLHLRENSLFMGRGEPPSFLLPSHIICRSPEAVKRCCDGTLSQAELVCGTAQICPCV